jgi:L-lactate utilization protein LutB
LGVSAKTTGIDLPVHFLGPNVTVKRRQLAESRTTSEKPGLDLDELKQTIIDIRKDSLINFVKYEKKLRSNLKDRANITFFSASSGVDVIDHISDNIGDISTLAINRSSTVREILNTRTEEFDVDIFDSYNEAVSSKMDIEFGLKDPEPGNKVGYWNFPRLEPIQIWSSFTYVPGKRDYYRSSSPAVPSEYSSLIGVNCVSADGNIFLLQHLQNISNIISNSKITFFVIGLEKLVGSYEQAALQTRCAALYGYDSILLDLFGRMNVLSENSKAKTKPKSNKVKKSKRGTDEEAFFDFKLPPDVHLIILDNGRKDLLGSEFQEILRCIGCNACSKLCPRTRRGQDQNTLNARDIIMSSLIFGLEFGINNGLFNCTLCRNCQDICPVDIPLNDYLLKLRAACEREKMMPEVLEQIHNNILNYKTPYGEGLK